MKVKIKSNAVSIGIISVLIVIIAALVMSPYAPKASVTSSAIDNQNTQSANSLNTFKGVITNANLAPQKLEGVATTDKGCGDVGNGLVQCSSDIVTSKGTLNFEYRHNMNVQPCLAMMGQENVAVNILDSNGNAEVIRTQNSGGMVMHQ